MLVSFALGLAAGSAYSQPDPPVRALPPAPIVSVSTAPCQAASIEVADKASGCRWLELEADYLFWWVRRPSLNSPLVTSGLPGGTGVLADPNTFVVVGNGESVP
jgi:hypothetical protein